MFPLNRAAAVAFYYPPIREMKHPKQPHTITWNAWTINHFFHQQTSEGLMFLFSIRCVWSVTVTEGWVGIKGPCLKAPRSPADNNSDCTIMFISSVQIGCCDFDVLNPTLLKEELHLHVIKGLNCVWIQPHGVCFHHKTLYVQCVCVWLCRRP